MRIRILILLILISLGIINNKFDNSYPKEVSSALESFSFHSVKGCEINVLIFNSALKPTVLIIGGVHGDEPSGVDLAQALVKELKKHSESDLTNRVVIIPVANPDGLAKKTRVNAHGVDINRNFPTKDYRLGVFKIEHNPGKKPASEPETQAILDITQQYQPALILTFHAELGCINYDGPGEEIAQAISNQDGLPVRKDLGYGTQGSLGTYYGKERNIPVITFELLSVDNQWERHGEAILDVIGIKTNINQ